jgi:hypothetical protein
MRPLSRRSAPAGSPAGGSEVSPRCSDGLAGNSGGANRLLRTESNATGLLVSEGVSRCRADLLFARLLGGGGWRACPISTG